MAGTITALVAQKRNKNRVNVYLDGEFAFGLALIEAIKLHKGQVLDDDEVARLKALDEIEVAHEQALRFLSYRPRSAEEIRRNLSDRKRQYHSVTVEAVIERLERAGLVDDRAFARFWIENREQFAPRSARALRYELRQKGVPDEVIRAEIEGVDEEEAAFRAAQSKARRYTRADEQTFRSKLGGYLTRRGFSYDTIRQVLDRLWAEIDSQAHASATDDVNLDGEA